MEQFIYALLSIFVIVLVIIFGVASESNYVPPGQSEKLGPKRKGGEPDASTD